MFKYKLDITKSIFLITACSICLFSYADGSTNFIHVRAELGRQQTIVASVVKDSLAYLWLNSDLGILRFNGYDYCQYSHNETITSITEGKKNTVWFSTYKDTRLSKLQPDIDKLIF